MTLQTMLAQSVERYADRVALRFKRDEQWQSYTYRTLLERIWIAAEMLAAHKIKPGDRVGLYRDNAPDWAEMYFAIVGLGATAVPVDARLQKQEVAHILRDSGVTLLLSDARHYPLLCDIEAQLRDIRTVILVQGETVSPDSSRRVRYLDYAAEGDRVRDRAMSDGRAYDRAPPSEEDFASFIYTSGTTGRQKGAMLSHANFTANVSDVLESIQVEQDDNFLLVLPLHHAFAFTANLLTPLAAGASISFVENLKTVGENTREVSPTILIGVPLLIEKMYNRIWTGLKANKPAWTLYRLGLRKPVRNGIAAKLGGKLRLLVTGGAPCEPAIMRGFAKLGVPILEGYGLTETAPVLTFNPIDDLRPGTVGRPLPNVSISIMDPNEEGIGEIAARGPNVMTGYYNDPEATADLFKEGWFLTGDMGYLDEDGYLTITGRKKSLIVNREGKNIYPEEVEHVINRSPYVLESVVLGFNEGNGTFGERVGVIIVPNQEALDKYGTREKRALSEEETKALIRSDMYRVCKDISEYKRPRRIQLRWEEFEKTSTGKIKRYLYALESDLVEPR